MNSQPAFYFGCKSADKIGHYLWDEHGRERHQRHNVYPQGHVVPAMLSPDHYWILDGTFCPSGPQVEGRALRHHLFGWTVLAFWDRSADHRGASNSVFILPGELTFDEAWTEAQRRFPWVVSRFSFSVVDAAQPVVAS